MRAPEGCGSRAKQILRESYFRERTNIGGGTAAIVRLKADDAAERGGNADGAASVRTDTAEAKPGGNRGSGASARTSGNTREIPRIAHWTVVGIIRRHAVGKL